MKYRWLVLWLCLTGPTRAEYSKCQSLGAGERVCTTIHQHFSGAMVVRDWMREAEADPYLRVIEGARAGALLIDKAILRRNEKQQWVVSLPGQDPVFLLGPTDPGPSKPLRILAASHFWEIKVVKVAVPRSIPGVATEEEVKLTLHILRISPDSPS